jgi:carboxymethylenebutenolidase
VGGYVATQRVLGEAAEVENLPVPIHQMKTMARSTADAAAAMIAAVLGLVIVLAACADAAAQSADPARVTFASMDGRTKLVGYVFTPGKAGRAPAVVMMHGRAGPYSIEANGRYDASTLSERHQMWGHLWASLGYVAILVDGFGPRGYPQGFTRGSYDQRPETLNEVTMRPLDAYGALGYLRTRPDVATDGVVLQGWSNGGSATLATMAVVAADTPGAVVHSPVLGFRAALAFYPACGMKGMFEDGYRPYAPIRVFIGEADEEVSPKRCATLVEKSRAQGGDIAMKLYPGATHDFDDPGRKRQSVDGNVTAKADALEQAPAFFAEQLTVKR